ncbi:MAG: hypothetical protein IJU71_09915, partial [Selenomonadaceae bacterium]|nr:hypothetical protein [Selenomonadaceae bacterium]
MIDETVERRQRTGEFYTPLAQAWLGLKYLQRVVDVRSDRIRLWDMAAGTGNLERVLPPDMLSRCYISTLLDDDADHCRALFPSATVFQYDYLNDDDQKLPSALVDELNDPMLEWLIFINPPYAMANNFERRADRIDKSSLSMTKVRELMTADGLGAVSRELYAQFLYRIDREFRGRRATLAMFSKLNYMISTNDQRLRDRFFDYEFEGGFLFPSKIFPHTKGSFPIGFLIWRLDEHIPLSEQKIIADVFDEAGRLIGTKEIYSAPRSELLSNWIERPPCTKKFPPLSSALKVGALNKDRRDRIADGFLASLMCNGNDFTHQIKTALLSGPYASAGGMSITPSNFERAMVVHAVRHLERATWLNDKDQFYRPTAPLPTEFVNDCVVWSLFAPSNCTTALTNVEYEGETYRIKNNLYPWEGEEERFAARWLRENNLSKEARAVVDAARPIYETFYDRLNELDRKKFFIETWDAG